MEYEAVAGVDSIDGRTQLLGVLGQGIEFTLSPALNNCAARHLRLNSVYVPLQLNDPAALADTLRFLHASNFIGLNVTTPFKLSIAQLLRSPMPSTNTLYRDARGNLCAASTDGEGFWRALTHADCEREAVRTVTVLGNGGVCAALLHFFCQHRLPLQKITVLRRNASRDEALARINAGHYQLSCASFNPAQLQHALATDDRHHLLIQATSAPLHGDDLQRFCPALENFCGTVVDLIYDRPSALYHMARARQLKCQDGLPMLIEQARLGQRLWWGKCAPYDALATYLHRVISSKKK